MSPFPAEHLSTDVRTVDRELLDALRGGDAFGINDLTDRLGVTATAVRQRLERMLESGLVERTKVVAGRGRPTFSYRLTLLGHRRAGADHAELADAMWHEILALPNSEVRDQLLSGIGRRLGAKYRQQVVDSGEDGDSLASRMRSLSHVLAGQRIPTDVSTQGSLPVIGFAVCPHPDLASETDRKAMCHLEEQMLSEALGSTVHLKSCRLDGDQCCQFAPISEHD
jgi:predicted ArsR family transcriptional regulator